MLSFTATCTPASRNRPEPVATRRSTSAARASTAPGSTLRKARSNGSTAAIRASAAIFRTSSRVMAIADSGDSGAFGQKRRSDPLQPAEIAVRARDVAADLADQGVLPGKPALVAQPQQELERNRPAVEVPVKPEDVSLDRERSIVSAPGDRRAHTDVGDAAVTPAVDGEHRTVDPLARDQLVGRPQVGRRDLEARAHRVAVHDLPRERVG